ncbi:MAG: S8 family serine peptidase [Cellulomonas sp.]|uniref:S8 family serine peptidase n=1 Tax=Cellulomonas sp. TaxID=40001 RepID=UPI001A0D0E43|nr:S8 family serine peptidase [Cellulomonas sp.]MBF0686378.1 S8 family serine peptidase [Cellulomonas sp.]
MDPALEDLLEAGPPHEEVAVLLRVRDPRRPPAGVRVVASFGDVVSARVRRSDLLAVHDDDATLSEKAPRAYGPELHEPSSPEELALLAAAHALPGDAAGPVPDGPAAPTGAGVVVGVLDWGFDVAHPALRAPDGTTRLLALWDQRPAGPGARDAPPQPYGYGRLLGRERIERALATTDPYRALGYHPADLDAGGGAHGTHTSSIVAGLAPDAAVVAVNLGRQATPGVPLGSSSELLEAVRLVLDVAGDRPCVLNLSLGRHAGEHTGRSLVESALDTVLATRPGTAVVQSCGNYHDRRAHAGVLLRAGDSRTLRIAVDPRDRTPNEIDVWYPGRDRLRIELVSDDGRHGAVVAPGASGRVVVAGREVARVRHRERDPGNGDHQWRAVVEPDPTVRAWDVVLTAQDVVDGRVHAWIERDSGCTGCQTRFQDADADPRVTLGSICNGYLTLAVGAYDAHDPARPPASFSSDGPTRDGRGKPDLAAPGVAVLGARSTPRGDAPGARTTRMSGTSMAAPHVTGTVALMFEAAGRPLLVSETRALLLASCERPGPDVPPGRLGAGYLDPARAVALTRAAVRATDVARRGPRSTGPSEEDAMTHPDVSALDGAAVDLDVADGTLPDPGGPGLDPWPDAEALAAPASGDCCGGSDDLLADDLPAGGPSTPPGLASFGPAPLTEPYGPAAATSPWWHREALHALGVTAPPGDAADLFDAWVHGGVPGDRGDGVLQIVAAPTAVLARPLAVGDVVVVRPAGVPHAGLSLVVDPRLVPLPGGYGVRTAAGSTRRREPVHVVGRDGRVPAHVLVLRGGTPGDAESVPGRCPDVVVLPRDRPRVLVRGAVHPAVREVQRKLNAFSRHRVAAGAPALPGTPLVEDCVLGGRTADAVVELQRVTMPGQPREHDAKVGPHTWEQLDAVAVPVPGGPAVVTAALRLTTDGFGRALTWDEVVGLDTATVDLEVTASGMPVATMPGTVVVTLATRPPNRAAGAATVLVPVPVELTRLAPEAAHPGRSRYTRAVALPDVGPLLQVERARPEVATVVRAGGTSDAALRTALGWAPRGAADQPTTAAAGTSTGSAAREAPDAMALLRAGGVEVLDARLAPRPGWTPPAPVARLVRSPADLVYYSGHGLRSGRLAIDTESKQCPERGTYVQWIGPAALGWRSPMDVDVLVLAGCSVLHVDVSTSPPTGPGLEWATLLTGRGGPLAALLGYGAAAPCDSRGGDDIATAFGRRLAAGSRSFVTDWLEVNMDARATNAVAVDARGYWWIERTWGGLGSQIAGPRSLP